MGNEIFKNMSITSIIFENKNSMKEYSNNYYNHFLAGIIFENESYLNYTIFINGTVVPSPEEDNITNFSYRSYISENSKPNILSTEVDSYIKTFVPIQIVVDQVIIQMKTINSNFSKIKNKIIISSIY
ncbi:hypothetical protein U3516DRAFT_908713 [Neocallimastix sp. 'constans']